MGRDLVLKRVLIANRGEIAIRIARAAASLGMASVSVHSGADAKGLHTRVSTQARLLPGGLVRNQTGLFVNRDQTLRVERTSTSWTNRYTEGQEIVIPLKNGEGRFVATPEEVARIEGEGLVAFRYLGDDPNGSVDAIAGLSNAAGNVVGLMPHPENFIDDLVGGTDGRGLFESLAGAVGNAA